MRTRDITREDARTSGDPTKWQDYKSLRNKVNKEVDKDKKVYYKNLYTKHHQNHDVAATYKLAKNQVGWTKNSSPTSFLLDGRPVADHKTMAEIQMKTFTDKTKKLLNDLPPVTTDPCATLKAALDNWGQPKQDRSLFKLKPISRLDTLKIIKNLGNSSSSANDRIDAQSIKHGAGVLHGPITYVINLSITTSTFVSRWKIGKLLPLFKGKNLSKLDPKSFRPISLLPILGKITERAIQPQIMEFMTSSGQLNENHHSYRKGYSTVTTMLQLSDAIMEGCDTRVCQFLLKCEI